MTQRNTKLPQFFNLWQHLTSASWVKAKLLRVMTSHIIKQEWVTVSKGFESMENRWDNTIKPLVQKWQIQHESSGEMVSCVGEAVPYAVLMRWTLQLCTRCQLASWTLRLQLNLVGIRVCKTGLHSFLGQHALLNWWSRLLQISAASLLGFILHQCYGEQQHLCITFSWLMIDDLHSRLVYEVTREIRLLQNVLRFKGSFTTFC